MGFIDSNKNLWSIALTRLGRQYLANDSKKFSLDRIALSDQEINYNLVETDETYDSNVIQMPMLEPSSHYWQDFDSVLINRSFFEEQDVDYIPDFEYRIGTEFHGSNVFKLDNTIDDQYFDISYYVLPPNVTVTQNTWTIPHSSIIDMSRFLKYYCFSFGMEPIYPALNVGEGLTASPYWYQYEHKSSLVYNVRNEFEGNIRNWEPDLDSIYNSKWLCSDDYIGDNFVQLPDYRSFDDNRKNGITFRLKVQKEYLPRIFSYMTEYGIETIKDYIYIINNDPLIVPQTLAYGKMKYDYINIRIPIYLTKVI